MPLLDSPRMGKGFNLGREQRDNPPSHFAAKPFFILVLWFWSPVGPEIPWFPGKHRVEVCIKKMHLLEPVTESDRILRKKKMSETENRIFSHGIYRH